MYGYRLGSVIERMKLRGYLSEQGIIFEGSDEELEDLIVRNGFVSNGKVLIELANKNEKLTNEVNDIFDQGVSVIYYEKFFDLHESLMEETHISSSELLKNYLKEKRKDLTFSKNFFSLGDKATEDLAVAQEILRVWGENVVASADDLSEKAIYNYMQKYMVEKVAAKKHSFTAKLEAIPGFYALYSNGFLKIMRITDLHESTQNHGKDYFDVNIKKCLWYTACVENGCEELCRLFCDVDNVTYGGLKKMGFSRTKTLGYGGDCCDFHFYKK